MNDAILVASSLNGDKTAFRQIVERYQSMACAVAYSIIGEFAASEDAAQEAFITAWQQLSTLRDPEKLRSWLAGVVRNIARNNVRKHYRQPFQQLDANESMPSAAIAPDESAVLHEEEALLNRALADVPEQFREPLVLYYREHQSITEVAMTMGLTEDAVKQRLARGRAALKDQVAKYVESALRRTGPSAAFTAGVLATINSSAGTASAATVAGTGAAASTSSMATGAAMGLVGGIGGSLLGIAGGVFGTACSIRNARSPAERALMIKAAWFGWIYVTIVTAGYLYVVFCQRWLFTSVWFQATYWTIYSIILVTSIVIINKKAARLRNAQVDDSPVST